MATGVNLGDRLVFSNGVVVLATASGLLLWIYNANTNSLIHLYVIGVFTAFTHDNRFALADDVVVPAPHLRLDRLAHGRHVLEVVVVLRRLVRAELAQHPDRENRGRACYLRGADTITRPVAQRKLSRPPPHLREPADRPGRRRRLRLTALGHARQIGQIYAP